METTTLLFCGKPALPAQAVVKQSQLLISLGAHKMTSSAGMQISYYGSEAEPLTSDASSNYH